MDLNLKCIVKPTHPSIQAAFAEAIGGKPVLASLYVVVQEWSYTKPETETSDPSSMLKVYDDSVDDSIVLMLFFKELSLLPALNCAGDVMFLHNVQCQYYKHKRQILGTHKNKFSFCVFYGSPDPRAAPSSEHLRPYFCSCEHFELEDGHTHWLLTMRALARGEEPLHVEESYMRRVHDIHTMAEGLPEPTATAQLVDLRCKVIAVDERMHGPRHLAVLWVWDGTDAAPLALRTNIPLAVHLDDPPVAGHPPVAPLQLRRRAMPLGEGQGVAVGEVPDFGSVLCVLVATDRVKVPKAGAVVKLKRMAVVVAQGQVQGVLLKRSHCSDVTHDRSQITRITKDVAGRWQQGRINNWAPQSRAALLATTSAQDVPLTTIRKVLQCTHQGSPGTFRIMARVLQYLPRDSADVCLEGGSLGVPAEELSAGGWTFCLKLHLEDPTGELEAVIIGRDGNQWFNGMLPTDLQVDHRKKAEVQRQLERLVHYNPVADPSSGWLECCIASYVLDATSPLQTSGYRIVNSTLQPPAQST